MSQSPFKFLDSYTKDDKDIFFGREREVEELYHRVFEGKILLVYGVSGTGKSSLIHCGLANKFNEADWLPINVRRAGDMVRSMAFAIGQAAITPVDGEVVSPGQFKKAVRSLYLDHYKPVFFIFDQFEELFIFGNKEEKKAFIQIVKALTESDLQCRFMFVLREEYLAAITEFERVIPTILSNRVRIEKMTLNNAKQVIEGPCKVFGIDVEEGFAEDMLEKLSPGSAEVELTYLQVYLDKVYRTAQSNPVIASEERAKQPERSGARRSQSIEGKKIASQSTLAMTFSKKILQKLGEVKDLLGSFLDEQIELLPDPDSALAVLKSFVSVKGTKRQMSHEEVKEYAQTLGKTISNNALQELFQTLIQLRILRDKDQNNRYELRHDALANNIYEKITLVEKELLEIRNLLEIAVENHNRRLVFLTKDDLEYIAPYLDKIILSKQMSSLVEDSKRRIGRRKRRIRAMFTAAIILLIFIMTGFTIWALQERSTALDNEIKFEASYLNSVAKEIVKDDATKALRLAEYAYSLKPEKEFKQNILKIFRENVFYGTNYKVQVLDPYEAIFDRDGNYCLLLDKAGQIGYFDESGNKLFNIYSDDFPLYTVTSDAGIYVDAINNADVSPSGNLISIVGDTCVYLYSKDCKKIINYPLLNNERRGRAVFTSDEKTLVYFRRGSEETLKVSKIDILSGDISEFSYYDPRGIESPSISIEHKYFAYMNKAPKGDIHIIDTNGKEFLKIRNLYDDIVELDIDERAERVYAITGVSKEVFIWNFKGELIKKFIAHTDFIIDLKCVTQADCFITYAIDDYIKIWDKNGNLKNEIKGASYCCGIVYSNPGEIKCFFDNGANISYFLVDYLVSALPLNYHFELLKVSFSPNDKFIIAANDSKATIITVEGEIILEYKDPYGDITGVLIMDDENRFYLSYADGKVRAYSFEGDLLNTFSIHSQAVWDLKLFNNKALILSGSADGHIKVWDAITGEIQCEFETSSRIASVAVSEDQERIIFSDFENTVYIGDLNGNIEKEYKVRNRSIISNLALTSDNELIAASGGHYLLNYNGEDYLRSPGSRTIWRWNSSGELVQTYNEMERLLHSVSISSVQKIIGKAYLDGNVIISDFFGNEFQQINLEGKSVHYIQFSNNGKYFITFDEAKSFKVWKVSPDYNTYNNEFVFDELTIGDKLRFGIISELPDEKNFSQDELVSIVEAYQELSSESVDQEEKLGYIKDALDLISRYYPRNKELKFRKIYFELSYYLLVSEGISSERFYSNYREIIHDSDKETCLHILNRLLELIKMPGGEWIDKMNVFDIFHATIMKFNDLTVEESNSKRTKQFISGELSGISYRLLLEQQFTESLKLVELAFELDSTVILTQINLPPALLLNNRVQEASNYYKRYKNKIFSQKPLETYMSVYIQDLDQLESLGITHPYINRIREILEQDTLNLKSSK